MQAEILEGKEVVGTQRCLELRGQLWPGMQVRESLAHAWYVRLWGWVLLGRECREK